MNDKNVMGGLCPDSTSLLDGFGDSCDLGANSVRAPWARAPMSAPSVPLKLASRGEDRVGIL
ncbi:hypothetical protein RYH73_07985 [Olivibacter sp. CPCC 100613]|uniref:hypothetical protein n=1 Tax=Olivibacter sp. CPCC 100613 TaxID=3079931 RepID=UPI002FF7E733